MYTATVYLCANTLFEYKERIYKLVREIESDVWQAEDRHTKRIVELPKSEILNAYATGALYFLVSGDEERAKSSQKSGHEIALKHLSPDQYAKAKNRRTYVIAVLGCRMTKSTIDPVLRATWEKQGCKGRRPNFASVCRWRRRYLEAGGNILSLADAVEKKGNRNRKIPQELINIIERVVDEVYLTLERKTIQDALDATIHAVSGENALRSSVDRIPLPTWANIKSVIVSIPAYDRYVARHGRSAADIKFRATYGLIKARDPLDRAEIDSTRLDIFVVDDRTGLPCGRPWITVCIDAFTRCILGFYLSFEPPSYLSVARALKHAFLPKVGSSEAGELCKHSWDAYGVMHALVVDNGMEYHSDALEQACGQLGIDIYYCKRKTPWMKGHIERFLGTLNRGVAHGHRGTTFSNIFEKGDYDPVKHAVVKLSTLRKIIHLWITDYYHQRTHRVLCTSPAAFWKEHINDDDIPLAPNPDCFDAILGAPVTRKLDQKGIIYEDLPYNSIRLTNLRKELGASMQVQVRVDRADLGHVFVINPKTKNAINVPVSDGYKDYATGLSLWQHSICQKLAASEIPNLVGVEALAEAKARISALVAADFHGKKRRSRTSIRDARWRDSEKKSPVPNQIELASVSGVPTQPTYEPGHNPIANDPTASLGFDLDDAPVPVFIPVVSMQSPNALPISNSEEGIQCQ